MNYEQYLKRVGDIIKNSKPWQKISAGLAVVIILVMVVIVINPAKKLLEMRNSQRRTDVVNILNSVYQYSLDHGGALPASITSEPTMICKSKASSCEGLVDISGITGDKKYLLSAVPTDPKEKNTNSSGYQISRLANGRISVAAPLAENKAVISLSK